METNRATAQQICITEIASDSSETTIAGARELLLEYGRFVIAQPGAARFCFGSLEDEAAKLPATYHAQGGSCLVAHLGKLP